MDIMSIDQALTPEQIKSIGDTVSIIYSAGIILLGSAIGYWALKDFPSLRSLIKKEEKPNNFQTTPYEGMQEEDVHKIVKYHKFIED